MKRKLISHLMKWQLHTDKDTVNNIATIEWSSCCRGVNTEGAPWKRELKYRGRTQEKGQTFCQN